MTVALGKQIHWLGPAGTEFNMHKCVLQMHICSLWFIGRTWSERLLCNFWVGWSLRSHSIALGEISNLSGEDVPPQSSYSVTGVKCEQTHKCIAQQRSVWDIRALFFPLNENLLCVLMDWVALYNSIGTVFFSQRSLGRGWTIFLYIWQIITGL